MQITSIALTNFKKLARYHLNLSRSNILVGPNNCGKSTILDALRALGGVTVIAHDIPASSLPITLENSITNYGDESAIITFRGTRGVKLSLQLHPDRQTKLVLHDELSALRSASRFKAVCPLDVIIVPTLAPFEQQEDILSPDYVSRNASTRLSNRAFRNYWYQNPDDFDQLAALVRSSWPDIEITRPELGHFPKSGVYMYFEEKRISREIYWAGFGFQVWLQLMTHILRSGTNSILVVDEPDIYLHPDLQRSLMKILDERCGQFVIATHSSEIINTADPDDIVPINPLQRSAKRAKDLDGLQSALTYIGSSGSVYLTKQITQHTFSTVTGRGHCNGRRHSGH